MDTPIAPHSKGDDSKAGRTEPPEEPSQDSHGGDSTTGGREADATIHMPVRGAVSVHAMSGDVAMRTLGDNFPVPTFDDPAWVTPKPLSESKVEIGRAHV